MKNPRRTTRSAILFTTLFALLVLVCSGGENKRAVETGGKVIPFVAKAIGGATVKFPGDYKGKVVLLDFWATWCGPCRAELPNVTAAYDKFHTQGFEVLSVSLDKPGVGPMLIKFTQENHMPWPQIYDGRFWEAELAVKYIVRSIPCPILVDGDTGVVIAMDSAARGHKLAALIEKTLAEKKTK